MKALIVSLVLLGPGMAAALCQAQSPGLPENNGLVPRTGTFDVNSNLSNGGTESLGVNIAANNNVIIGWEDDGDLSVSLVTDFEAVWTLYDRDGNLLTPPTTITSLFDPSQSISTTYRSFFRSDGSPTPAYAAWGPKIKANRFGTGIGMGATAFYIGVEIPELLDINLDDDELADFPVVQLMDQKGSPQTVVTGVTDADAQPAGAIRIADWDYLSNGNIVIVNESRQSLDLVTRFGGATPGVHATYRIVSPTGEEVKAYSLVSETPTPNAIWHGVGVTTNGFAVRFNKARQATVRMFDNAGNPTTGDINIATLTGIPETGGGGRGDNTGFHGNGIDAYVLVNTPGGNTLPATRGMPYVTVLNQDGTLRYSRMVGDPGSSIAAVRVDGAISPDGRVVAVFGDSSVTGSPLAQGRLLGRTGEALGGIFYVSERETADNAFAVADQPRVAWRNNSVAIVWLTGNSPAWPYASIAAARFFSVVPGSTRR